MFDVPLYSRRIRLRATMRPDFHLEDAQGLDAPEFVYAGSVEGIYDYDPDEDAHPGAYTVIQRDFL